jgi:Tol biopolymer transport system component
MNRRIGLLGNRLGGPICLLAASALVVLSGSAEASNPGANGKIAFWHESRIVTINPDGTAYTFGVEADPPGGSWSPDGQRIAYSLHNQVYIAADPSGTGSTPVVPGSEPSWSPDGTQLVLVLHNGASFCSPETTNIAKVNVDGTGLTPLTVDCDTANSRPVWSPDGTKIAFQSYSFDPFSRDRGFTDIYSIDQSGGARTNLTNERATVSEQPDWSPDGSKIAFHAFDFDGSGGDEVFSMNANGTVPTNLTAGNGYPANESPVWSPDGSKIAFAAFDEASPACSPACGRHIHLMNPDGSGQTAVTGFPGDIDLPSDWQPIVNRAPDCSAVAPTRAVLNTVNRHLVPVTLDGASDLDGDPVSIAVDGVTQDEPVRGRGDSTSPDGVDQRGGELRLRAERDSHGDGRVYRIAFTASDGRGGSCSDVADVTVPRKRKTPAVDSAPPSYDSLAR